MTGIPDNFDEFRRKTISQKTILAPQEKSQEIKGFITTLEKSKEIESLREKGIIISTKMNVHESKLIPPPQLALGNNKFVPEAKVSFFNLFGDPIHTSKHNLKLCIIHSKYADVGPMVTTLTETSKKLNVTLDIKKLENPMFKYNDVTNGINRCLKMEDFEPNILLIVIPNNIKT